MDLARAPRRAPLTARKKGSGYENGHSTDTKNIHNSSTRSHPSEDENRTRYRSKNCKCKWAFALWTFRFFQALVHIKQGSYLKILEFENKNSRPWKSLYFCCFSFWIFSEIVWHSKRTFFLNWFCMFISDKAVWNSRSCVLNSSTSDFTDL
jgi:hypothetical protein